MADSIHLSVESVIRRDWMGQLLFSAGHALTSGGFLNYFSDPYFRGFTLAFAVLQITQETSESLSVVTRSLVHRVGNPKTVWWVALLLARLFALVIPCVAIAGTESHPLTMLAIIVSLGATYLLLGISYTAYLSWLSAQVPDVSWGRMLATRSIAISVITILMTWTASRLVEWAIQETGWTREQVYPSLFITGGCLCLLSILPLSRVPGSPIADSSPLTNTHHELPRSSWQMIRMAWSNVSFRWFLLGSWQLAFFQGLTQTAQYQFSKNILKVSLFEYYSQVSLMQLLQIPLAVLSGRLVDRGKDRQIMVWGLLGLSLAMVFWTMAGLSGRTWLWGAYAVWGGFGLVNVAQPSLAMKLSPRGDNALQLSLVRPVGGMIAAIAGLMGGWILDRYASIQDLAPVSVFQSLFIISGIGRATAAWWFVGEESHRPQEHLQYSNSRNS